MCMLSLNIYSMPRKKNINIYVSLSGNDNNTGTFSSPVRSVEKALSIIQKSSNKRNINIIFEDGTYYIEKPIIITPSIFKNTDCSLTLKSANEGKAILSGGKRLFLKWKKGKNGIYEANIPSEISNIDQLYINGKMQRMARYPNAIEGKNVFDTWNLQDQTTTYIDPINKENVKRWKNPTGAYIHTMHQALWGDMHWQVIGKENEGLLIMEGGWQNNRPSKMHPVYRMIENIYEELDAPTEFFFDSANNKLFYIPEDSVDLNCAKVEIVLLENLFHITGTTNSTIKNIHIEGFKFTHTARTFMKNQEPLLRSDWTIYRNGTILFENVENCSVKDCEFDQVGGNTIIVSNYNRGISIKSCYIHDSGANGIVFVGNPKAVKNPLFGYVAQDYSKIDRTLGPINNNYPQECAVEDCLITRTGRHEKQTAPIQISMSYRIKISHCSIYDVPRAGININEGTFGGHIIEYCDVFNTVLETGDHGSFNSWGRDRYWTPNINTVAEEVKKDSILPYLDMIEKNVIRNCRWRCDHGWDIDLDDDSSFYHIYNNILLNGGLKLREGYKRIVKNNLIINNSLHPHVWYRNSDDVITGNIFFQAYQPALMEENITNNGKWGKMIDYNYFLDEVSMNKYNKNGCDLHSKVIKPEFIDASNGDYTLIPNSTVLKAGFKNIDMNFGVLSEKLKAIAQKPVFPTINLPQKTTSQAKTFIWQGLMLKTMETLGEQSALGYKVISGLIVQSIENDSPWKDKINVNDLMIGCNGKEICTIEDLKKITTNSVESIKVWRTQGEIILKK